VPPLESIVYWAFWVFVVFLPAELYAAFRTPGVPDTFSEFCWWVFDERWKRGLLATFGAFLIGHLAWHWTVIPIAVLGAPVAGIVGWKVVEATMGQYSFVKTLGKLGQHVVEIGGAIVITIGPQLITDGLNLLSSTPPEQLHIPAGWVAVWFLVIRGVSNWWKNRK
jgi:hypothetical protein